MWWFFPILRSLPSCCDSFQFWDHSLHVVILSILRSLLSCGDSFNFKITPFMWWFFPILRSLPSGGDSSQVWDPSLHVVILSNFEIPPFMWWFFSSLRSLPSCGYSFKFWDHSLQVVILSSLRSLPSLFDPAARMQGVFAVHIADADISKYQGYSFMQQIKKNCSVFSLWYPHLLGYLSDN